MSFQIIVFFFCICYAGVRLYRSFIINNFSAVVKTGEEGALIANGAGGIFWDVFLIFCLYLWLYHKVHPKLLVVFLCPSLFFTIMGWLDDLNDFTAHVKLISQTAIACISVIIYNVVMNWHFSLLGMAIQVFLLVWIVNAVNFIDILDGLSSSISLLIFISLFIIFKKSQILYLELIAGFWIIASLVFFIQNIRKPDVYLGDAGAHLFGTMMFFMSCEYYSNILADKSKSFLPIIVVFSFLVFDFLYVCGRRWFKKQSIMKKSKDHLALVLSEKTASVGKTVLFMSFFQFCASFLAIWIFLYY